MALKDYGDKRVEMLQAWIRQPHLHGPARAASDAEAILQATHEAQLPPTQEARLPPTVLRDEEPFDVLPVNLNRNPFVDAMATTITVLANSPVLSQGVNESLTSFKRWTLRIELFLPKRIVNEDLGDALEVLARYTAAGGGKWGVRIKICSVVFWLLVNSVREFMSALLGKKKPD